MDDDNLSMGDVAEHKMNTSVFGIVVGFMGSFVGLRVSPSLDALWFHEFELRPLEDDEYTPPAKEAPAAKADDNVIDFTKARELRANSKTKGGGVMGYEIGDKVIVTVTDKCLASNSVKVGRNSWLWPDEVDSLATAAEPVAVADSNGNMERGNRFKVGDRVRALDSCGGGGFFAGDVYTVSHVYEDYSGPRISVEVDSAGSKTNGWGAWHFELVDAPLTIQSGKFYRTRDGRKVGPMTEWDTYGSEYQWESGGYLWKDDGENYDKDSVHTIIAEWTDEPGAASDSSNDTIDDWYFGKTAGYTVPLEAPEFGGAESKFRVGDRVEIIDVGSCPERYLGTQFTIDNDEDDFDGEQAWSGRDHKSPYRFKESQLRLVAEATTAQEPLGTIADIVRRLEALEAKQPIESEHCIGDKVTLSATVTGMNKRRFNVVIDGVPQPGGSLAVPPAALRAA